MKRSIKKLSIVGVAALFIGAGVTGFALAATDAAAKTERMEKMDRSPAGTAANAQNDERCRVNG